LLLLLLLLLLLRAELTTRACVLKEQRARVFTF
jgi:hypothetical protein